jgi:hypothetical protein
MESTACYELHIHAVQDIKKERAVLYGEIVMDKKTQAGIKIPRGQRQ